MPNFKTNIKAFKGSGETMQNLHILHGTMYSFRIKKNGTICEVAKPLLVSLPYYETF